MRVRSEATAVAEARERTLDRSAEDVASRAAEASSGPVRTRATKLRCSRVSRDGQHREGTVVQQRQPQQALRRAQRHHRHRLVGRLDGPQREGQLAGLVGFLEYRLRDVLQLDDVVHSPRGLGEHVDLERGQGQDLPRVTAEQHEGGVRRSPGGDQNLEDPSHPGLEAGAAGILGGEVEGPPHLLEPQPGQVAFFPEVA